jgi:subtilase family serine protease
VNTPALASLTVHPNHRRIFPSSLPQTNSSFFGSNGAVSGLGLRSQYGLPGLTVNSTQEGKQVIAIIDAYGYLSSNAYNESAVQPDFAAYATQNSLPTTGLIAAATEGSAPGKQDDASAWAEETAIDVEMAHAAAPDAEILLVAAATDGGNDLLSAVDFASNYHDSKGNPVTVVSMSWGADEFTNEALVDVHFHHAGVTYLASTGDKGSTADSGGGTGIQWPAEGPTVLAVGGTKLTFDASGNNPTEIAWNDSGGGTSLVSAAPTYQAFTHNAKREIPDVSGVAAAFVTAPGSPTPSPTPIASGEVGINFVQNGGQSTAEGTSFAAPFWAGMIALSKALSPSGNLQTVNLDLYSLAVGVTNSQADFSKAPADGQATYTTDFNDINSGISNGAFTDGPGYDPVTGLGSPIGPQLFPALSQLP